MKVYGLSDTGQYELSHQLAKRASLIQTMRIKKFLIIRPLCQGQTVSARRGKLQTARSWVTKTTGAEELRISATNLDHAYALLRTLIRT